MTVEVTLNLPENLIEYAQIIKRNNISTVQVKTELPFNELLNAVEQLNLSDLEQLMFQIITLQARRKAPSLPKDESELLLKINQGLPASIQKRFNELVAKRQAETLTPDEHQELLDLTDQIEKSDAKRVEYMVKLAKIRGISLSALMKNLSVRHPAYV
jgi:hypothetical protein